MKTLCAALAATALFYTLPASAECRKLTQADIDASRPHVIEPMEIESVRQLSFSGTAIDVEANHPINEPFAIGATASQGAIAILICQGSTRTVHFEVPGAVGTGVYPTGAPGVGFRIKHVRGSGTTSTLPETTRWTRSPEYGPEYPLIGDGATFVVELIKTGPMNSVSVVNLGTVVQVSGAEDRAIVFSVNADSVILRVLPHCWVTSNHSEPIDFGTFGPSEVSATAGPTKPVVIDLTCDGPTAPNTVSATLAATPDPAVPDYIRNVGGADNLAIRLRDSGSQQVLKPQNASSTLVKTTPGFNTSFALEATVLRVGSAAPTPGMIDAHGIVTLSFQ
ncbi:fimbrial protein [Achromobacter arsenitoxydans]|uniref:Fimbrial-type adhesion domain-containing protein n=1 Tax=Achromobacter arsenitoxydans SY8 TaxID=477184 RepID=H0FER0_9BURK|nr:fimbrial protein [Achromobacter arsenitoxydans]EHK63211.1 hypothetical protein KYC_26372 [Achromobacter arsenitoxydans SY8]